jgi:hypothetical protein
MSLLQVANHYLQLNLQSKHMRGGRRGIKEEGRKRGRRHGEREGERGRRWRRWRGRGEERIFSVGL